MENVAGLPLSASCTRRTRPGTRRFGFVQHVSYRRARCARRL
jgi:hypothetical protein